MRVCDRKRRTKKNEREMKTKTKKDKDEETDKKQVWKLISFPYNKLNVLLEYMQLFFTFSMDLTINYSMIKKVYFK